MGTETAVGFFRHGVEILLSRNEGVSPSPWWTVSVSVEDGRAGSVPERLTSIAGRPDATLLRRVEPLPAGDDTDRRIRPFLFECDTRDVTVGPPDAVHEWTQPPALFDRDTEPWLWDAYLAVAPSVRTVREDTDHGAAFLSLRALEVLRDRAASVAEDGGTYEQVADTARQLRSARPSMGVIGVRIDRVMTSAERTPESVRERAIAACADAVDADRRAAKRVASLLGDHVLTLSRSGTVESALEVADPRSVLVAESRPDREGVDTAERLSAAGIDVTVLTDAAIEGILADGEADTVLVGADTVLADGGVVNKVGTRTAMRAATESGADGYVVCSRDKIVPETTFDPEPGPPEAIYAGGADLAVHNPTFERAPPEVVPAIVTEADVYTPDGIEPIARKHASYRRWDD